MHPFLAPAPAPLKTWRVKPNPRRLVELDPASVSDGAAAAVAAARAGLPAVPDAPKTPPRRKGSVRLARLNPELVRRLEEAKFHDGEEISEPTLPRSSPASPPPMARARSVSRSDTSNFLPEPPRGEPSGSLEGPRSWSVAPPDWSPPMSLPRGVRGLDRLPPGPALVRDTPCPWRDTSLLRDRDRRMPGDPLDTLERDRLLEGLGLQQRHARVDLQDVLPLETRKEFAEERQGHIREIEDLRQHVEELTEVVRRLQAERAAARKQHKEELAQCIKEESLRLAQLHEERQRTAQQEQEQEAVELREKLGAEYAEALEREQARLAQEHAAAQKALSDQHAAELQKAREETETLRKVLTREVTALRVKRRDAAVTALERSASEILAVQLRAWARYALAQRETRKTADAVALKAASIRARAYKQAVAAIATKEAQDRITIFHAWHATTLKQRCTAALHRVSDAERGAAEQVSQAIARVEAAAEKRQKAALAEAEARQQVASTTREAQSSCAAGLTNAGALSGVRSRAGRAGLAWATAIESAAKLQAFGAWRVLLTTRRSMGAMQAKLFAEEAKRNALLKAQRGESDARLTEAEARHREALHKARAELVEAEARHADVLAAQEAQAAQRIAVSEVDFSAALRQAIRQQESQLDDSMASEADSTAGGDALFGEALRTLRERTDARILEAEARHTEALRVEREQMNIRLTEVEARVEEEAAARSSSSIREAARRLQEVEERHATILEAQRASFEFLMVEAEKRHSDSLRLEKETADALANTRIAEMESDHAEALHALRMQLAIANGR
mmetsp:Transcript_104645/g.197139  ORF Transcript_104645/g.197139 Transcript_104645/m.197139 type:complete len:801 (-) Transcript_104645:86-2488(-)